MGLESKDKIKVPSSNTVYQYKKKLEETYNHENLLE